MESTARSAGEGDRIRTIRDHLRRDAMTTRSQVEAALREHGVLVDVRLGELLLADCAVSEEQLARALALKVDFPLLHLGDLLVRIGAIDNATLQRILVRKLGVPSIDLRRFLREPVQLNERHLMFMRQHRIMPLFRSGARLVVAVENPLDVAPLRSLSFCTGLKVEAVSAPAAEITAALTNARQPSLANPGIEPARTHGDEVQLEPDAVLLVDAMIRDAVALEASDVHIETLRPGGAVRIRFRRDGVLRTYSELAPGRADALVARVKILSKLDIAEKRHAQDGRMRYAGCAHASVEVRVVTMPTADGAEDVVMRLQFSREIPCPEQLGLAPDVLATLLALSRKPHGLLMVCGPTGSGKTTTLHALMRNLNTPDRKIWTVEDPIEITHPGLRQVQVHAKVGWTFAAVLRSFLRADPDVIMVGETRDAETARIAAEAALTGHLVMSTMHTNGAVESVIRLLDLGLDPFYFADSLVGVLAQRLVRRLCPHCSRPRPLSPTQLQRLARAYGADTESGVVDAVERWRARHGDAQGRVAVRVPSGCIRCDHDGYKGRLGIHELLVATEALKAQVAAGATVPALSQLAVAQGMRTLRQDAIEKLLQGLTSWDQVAAI